MSCLTLFNKLDEYGILNDTYVFYTTDNGFHIGHHRLQPGKECREVLIEL